MVKTQWPELAGKDVEEAIASIKADRPDLKHVIAVPDGSMVTADHRLDRVRVFHRDGVVVKSPRVG